LNYCLFALLRILLSIAIASTFTIYLIITTIAFYLFIICFCIVNAITSRNNKIIDKIALNKFLNIVNNNAYRIACIRKLVSKTQLNTCFELKFDTFLQ